MEHKPHVSEECKYFTPVVYPDLVDQEMAHKIRMLSCVISQDVHDFKCFGEVTRLESFNAKLKRYSELQSEYAKKWQKFQMERQ